MTEEVEEWRPIPGAEDFYEVSSLGRVRSWNGSRHGIRRSAPLYLSRRPNKYNRYPVVSIRRNDGTAWFTTVHTLVCALHSPDLGQVGWRSDISTETEATTASKTWLTEHPKKTQQT